MQPKVALAFLYDPYTGVGKDVCGICLVFFLHYEPGLGGIDIVSKVRANLLQYFPLLFELL